MAKGVVNGSLCRFSLCWFTRIFFFQRSPFAAAARICNRYNSNHLVSPVPETEREVAFTTQATGMFIVIEEPKTSVYARVCVFLRHILQAQQR